MCGIAGLVEKNKKPASQRILKKMMAAVAHRGPDDEGLFIDGNVGLGHRRLSILDLSPAGRQPMSLKQSKSQNLKPKSSNIWITFNGEIYNYIELRKEIGGEYQTGTDTEVLLRAYQKWGQKCLEKLNGIFSFAIWDQNNQTLFCARDHLGVKPFYYAIQNGVFYFGSEIKALLAGGVKAKPNDKIIYDYLVRGFYHHSNEPFFDNIYQLPPGHALTLRNGSISIERYWDPAVRAGNMNNWTDKQVSDAFFRTFENAVKIQLRSDVPIGIQLSGGLDSSSLTAIVDLICGGQRNFNLFSFVYGNFPDREKAFMEAAAKKLGWRLDLLEVFPKDMMAMMEKVTWHQDEPFPGLPTFGQHVIAEECQRRGIKVILGGQGGDEIGGGYEYYMGTFLLDMVRQRGAEAALRELTAFGKVRPFSNQQELFSFFLGSLGSYFSEGTSADASNFVKTEVLRPEFLNSSFEPPKFAEPFDSFLSNMQYRDIFHTKLPRILHAADRSAMAHGVEHRVPFLDYRLVELGLTLPIRHRIRNGHQRFFIRKAMEHLLPKKVVWAPKRAVPSPQREWFKKELRPWVYSILSSKSFGQRPYFDQKKVLEEYNQYCSAPATPKNSFHIWQWLHLEYWLRAFFD